MLQLVFLIIKVLVVFLILLFIRGILPRYKINDLLNLWWQHIIMYTFSVFLFNTLVLLILYYFFN